MNFWKKLFGGSRSPTLTSSNPSQPLPPVASPPMPPPSPASAPQRNEVPGDVLDFVTNHIEKERKRFYEAASWEVVRDANGNVTGIWVPSPTARPIQRWRFFN